MTREKAKELLTDMMMSYVPKDQYGDYGDPEPYEQAYDMAIEALSAEAVQGEWIGSYECSVCGKQAFDFIEGYVDGVEYLPKFCPNCGAKMDKR